MSACYRRCVAHITHKNLWIPSEIASPLLASLNASRPSTNPSLVSPHSGCGFYSLELADGPADEEGEAGESGEAEGVEPAVQQAAFRFDESVSSWSDFLQPRLHPNAIAPLKAHTHGFSTLSRFPDGACVVEGEENGLAGGPELLERCRHALEACDSVGGLHLLLDANSGFGGMAAALLTRIRDVTPQPLLASTKRSSCHLCPLPSLSCARP